VQIGRIVWSRGLKSFAKELVYPGETDFYLYARDEATGLTDASRESPESVVQRRLIDRKQITPVYRLSQVFHGLVFDPQGPAVQHRQGGVPVPRETTRSCTASANGKERVSKAALFNCQDWRRLFRWSTAGTSVPCPSAARTRGTGRAAGRAARNVRWARSSASGTAPTTAPSWAINWTVPPGDLVIRNPELIHSSSWGNYYLGKDHAVASTCPEKLAKAADRDGDPFSGTGRTDIETPAGVEVATSGPRRQEGITPGRSRAVAARRDERAQGFTLQRPLRVEGEAPR